MEGDDIDGVSMHSEGEIIPQKEFEMRQHMMYPRSRGKSKVLASEEAKTTGSGTIPEEETIIEHGPNG